MTCFIAVVWNQPVVSPSVVILNAFNFYNRVKSDVCIILSVVHYSIFVYTFTFSSEIYTFLCFCISVWYPFISTSRTLCSPSYSGDELLQVFVSLGKSVSCLNF